MYGTILTFNKFNNFGTQHLNGPRRLFHSFYYTTQRIFKSERVYEPGFNMDKYGTYIHTYIHSLMVSTYHHSTSWMQYWRRTEYNSIKQFWLLYSKQCGYSTTLDVIKTLSIWAAGISYLPWNGQIKIKECWYASALWSQCVELHLSHISGNHQHTPSHHCCSHDQLHSKKQHSNAKYIIMIPRLQMNGSHKLCC